MTKDRFFTVAIVDTNGLLRGQKFRGADLPGVLAHGIGMSPVQLALDPTDDIMAMPGVTDDSADFHDSELTVDAASLRHISFERDEDSALYLAEFTGEAAGLCPRNLLRRVLARAAAMGLSTKAGIELEFTLFDETPRSLKAKGYEDLITATAHPSHDLIIYQAAQSDFYAGVADFCEPLRISLQKMHEEIGGGFMEACIGAVPALDAADEAVLLRNFLRVFAMRQDQTVCFMPRWTEDADSQSSHIHISLLDEAGQSLFWDADAPDHLSPAFRYFLGGLQEYLPGLMLLFAPTVNSWRRFAEGTFAPPAFSWGIENRTTAFRVVGTRPSTLRVENRLPCADANPHLAMAATLAAGLAGIAGKVEPTAPTTGNGYVPGVAKGHALPDGMAAAIDALEQSALAADWLGEGFVRAYCATRRDQVAKFAGKTLIDERRRFFELG
ncbi:glutamine synthetase family protein [Pararhodobacter zhoushanensis]|uniref:Glutamine synthetase family protein n=1 Tax=Pararhodobacter zhoushanensis TaxID=2479545 RepID=A0ABT3GZT4_9RHOB|nr:glutamine synthetase family protein [Pararhodobacter zhoushanensis]MCW1933059.1 glutamine synthetase family protein [Pararhodobacter zhoushanensis]